MYCLQNLLQECQKQEDSLIPLEQAARQKVAEMKTTRDSEKNQSTALKAILQAKESNEIQGIYGRLGDLGAIDGKIYSLCPQNQICPVICVA
jgi:structural maintenance of chromosome 4